MLFRFVRREKQIAVAQCEASEGEALRYKQRVEHQDRELKELQEALNAERERMQVTRDGLRFKGEVQTLLSVEVSNTFISQLCSSRLCHFHTISLVTKRLQAIMLVTAFLL